MTVASLDPETTIGELVVHRPARARVFEKFGLDYCCGGGKSLARACDQIGVDLDEVLEALRLIDQESEASDEPDWTNRSMTELADHIETTHHAYLRQELPRLERLVEKVAKAHGQDRPELRELRRVYAQFKDEIEHHTVKEERMLFPALRELERSGRPPEHFPFTSVHNPISCMLREHDDAGEALAIMRDLTDGYDQSQAACNTHRAMLEALARLERDTHRHVHKENNILFVRAIEAEQLRSPA